MILDNEQQKKVLEEALRHLPLLGDAAELVVEVKRAVREAQVVSVQIQRSEAGKNTEPEIIT